MTREEVQEQWEGEELLFCDGFDSCIIGVTGGIEPVVAYDADKMIESLMEDGLDIDEALEHHSYNISGAYVGPKTPIYVWGVGD